MLDDDLIRVDLLKIKRKIYNSYPENSEERKQFLLSSKLSEIGYLSKIVPPDVVNFVFEEYKQKVKTEIIYILFNVSFSIFLGLLLNSFYQLYPKNTFLLGWYIPSLIFVANAIRHFWEIAYCWWDMRNFKKEYKVINDRIKNLSNEMKRLGDGK